MQLERFPLQPSSSSSWFNDQHSVDLMTVFTPSDRCPLSDGFTSAGSIATQQLNVQRRDISSSRLRGRGVVVCEAPGARHSSKTMDCVVELPTDQGRVEADALNTSEDIAIASHSVNIAALSGDDEIPTFDARDVEQDAEDSRLRRLFWKSVIILASYNPVPLLRLTLIEAHSRGQHSSVGPFSQKPMSSIDHCYPPIDSSWDLEAQATVASACRPTATRADCLVDNLPVSARKAFRQRVLLSLLVYVGGVAVVVVICLLVIRSDAVLQVLSQSPYLLPVAESAIGAVALLSLWLVYVLRFDTPANYVALTALTASEIGGATLTGVLSDPNIVAYILILLFSGIVLLRALVGRHNPGDNESLLSPFIAAVGSIILLATVAIPLNQLCESRVSQVTTSTLIAVLGVVSAVLFWIAIVLSVLTQTMAADEHASGLVFFQADLIVVFIVQPTNLLMKYAHRMKRFFSQDKRHGDDMAVADKPLPPSSRPSRNAVVPAFWPDTDLTAPSMLKRATQTPSLSPRRPCHQAHEAETSTCHSQAAELSFSSAHLGGGTRRRSSASVE